MYHNSNLTRAFHIKCKNITDKLSEDNIPENSEKSNDLNVTILYSKLRPVIKTGTLNFIKNDNITLHNKDY